MHAFIPNNLPQALNPLIVNSLTAALAQVRDHISEHGDGVIPEGVYKFADLGFSWYSVNSNNHQQTYSVVKAALTALLGFMYAHGEYGTASFGIFNGANQVGMGAFGQNIIHDRVKLYLLRA